MLGEDFLMLTTVYIVINSIDQLSNSYFLIVHLTAAVGLVAKTFPYCSMND